VKRVRVTKGWPVLKTYRRLWSTIWLRPPHPVREFSISVDGIRPHEATEVSYEGNQALLAPPTRCRWESIEQIQVTCALLGLSSEFRAIQTDTATAGRAKTPPRGADSL
jgi:hypothetical protein